MALQSIHEAFTITGSAFMVSVLNSRHVSCILPHQSQKCTKTAAVWLWRTAPQAVVNWHFFIYLTVIAVNSDLELFPYSHCLSHELAISLFHLNLALLIIINIKRKRVTRAFSSNWKHWFSTRSSPIPPLWFVHTSFLPPLLSCLLFVCTHKPRFGV